MCYLSQRDLHFKTGPERAILNAKEQVSSSGGIAGCVGGRISRETFGEEDTKGYDKGGAIESSYLFSLHKDNSLK